MKRLALIALALAGLTACGGNGSVTLHGTFTDYEANTGGPASVTCNYEINPLNGSAPYRITVAEDNVLVGSVPVHWQDNGNAAPKVIESADSQYPLDACTGTWSMTLQSPAHTAYEIGISGINGTVPVPAGDSGDTIAINDGMNGNGDTVNGGAS